MFQCTDALGNPVATYDHYNQAEVYFNNSFPGAEFEPADLEGGRAIMVVDANGNELGYIKYAEKDAEKVEEMRTKTTREKADESGETTPLA